MVLGARLAGRLLILPLALVSLSMNTAQGSKMITSLHGAFSKSVKFPEGQGVIMFEPVITVLHIHWQIHPQPIQPCNNSLGFAGLAIPPLLQRGTALPHTAGLQLLTATCTLFQVAHSLLYIVSSCMCVC